ncbi:phosphatidylinositol 4,5-bisphosphate 3-kinase catalytic subunit alpha isoform-like [Mercenaria mercenaria]|uniref:phosphatidylinositol 4,5-bisphosphate 3-kinase catalytic subunit alpha isoform-like n=1 Tax=Mercenaria mercenaria TaxID=6596 RepID=UPI00234E6726|nr:phosphatidylinositol 4,5-bisphosphate 3-kinase catalytic subunit alpha isoform-like [Mercenaria mercenaria]XP_045163415.2 phosphatidylinositol 4,5-bisphosphate 3-kinase catalytic subunit alpha isoform-like [Mercenaria mercenaria]XP_045163416.2 phosphatidylinositol 4,5-bisphosphate 3-kinase catalytic subunit alpha isoform-like [Mercenaria mercenaria]XP_045163417.2 phosphatidylinositol 4,5-bisphosphate 3-kinase catalytic subunit alpha isoform-like [Mercenaria mercenaria]
MPPSSGELWGHHLMPLQIHVDCLMPTGILLPLRCNRDATMERIKSDLWAEAKRWPLFSKLLDPSSYIFVGITQDAEREEFYDETRRLCDLRLFQPILKVVEPKGNREEKMQNYTIGMTVGIPVNEFNEMKELEVMTFRRNILKVCKEAVEDRKRNGKHSLALYTYPPDVESSAKLPSHLEQKLQQTNKHIYVCIWVVQQDKSRNKYTVKLPHTAKPNDVIAETIRRRSRNMGRNKEEIERCIEGFSHTYVLKVCGCDQFLFEGYPISQYRFIRDCIAGGVIPQLMLLKKENVHDALRDTPFHVPSYVQRGVQALTDINNKQTLSLLEMNVNFKIKIHCATYVNVKEKGNIYVKAGLYHGTEPLCEVKQTKEVDNTNPRWNQWLEFLYLPDIPRSSKICFSICSVSKKKNKKTHYALAWGNLQVFDFNNRLLNDKFSLHLWSLPHGLDETLNPIGIPGSNPDRDCPCLEIEFEKFSPTLSYPPDSQLEELAMYATNRDRGQSSMALQADDWRLEESQLMEIISRDPLYEISEQEKELLWKRRDYCLHQPNSLPKLLSAIKWNERENVAQLYMLLKQWPTVTPEVALQLLDCSFTDLKIRQFAVHCLEIGMADDKLQQYLLQFVQALKFEPYLDNPVARFLLKRSLMNQRIGQKLFWQLKSELHHKATRVRFGLILEALCRSCGPFLQTLSKQVEAIEKMTKLTNMLKYDVKEDKIEQMKCLHDQLQQPDYQECLQSFTSPLNSSHRLGLLSAEECEVKMSKKRPLWMVWRNPDDLADLWYQTYTILFKNGDDLRQDMLTLQVISVMDSIWKSEGFDLRLTPYCCLATGQDVGLIEAVRDSTTIMKIQEKGGAKATWQIGGAKALHSWIKQQNADRYEEAIDTFTRSCAGYSVATFVLGIGDRHSENIMVARDGRVFHIDFGHFLNHKKKKFGINRERVPFVLTEDFMCVIARGRDQPHKTKDFEKFQQLCVKIYLVLRKQADLIINLFTMMLSCGIPELQSLDDIGYVRKTLAVDKTEEEAILYFTQQLNSAYKDQKYTKIDWFFHQLNSK